MLLTVLTWIAVAILGLFGLMLLLSRRAGERSRRVPGAAMLLAAVPIALELHTGFPDREPAAAAGGGEQTLWDRPRPAKHSIGATAPDPRFGDGMIRLTHGSSPDPMINATDRSTGVYNSLLPVEGGLPPLGGAAQWLNSPPLTDQDLRGKVVVINIWTYSCINCLRSLRYVKAWADKYRNQGLVVIGVHAPEFAFERNIDNVRKATRELSVDYPVAIDNNFAIWRGLGNEYWPAQYFIDAHGQIRHHNFGEGNYAKSEKVIQILFEEAGNEDTGTKVSGLTNAATPGIELPADVADLRSPETYIGYAQADNFASPGGETRDQIRTYVAPVQPAVNDWGLAGKWDVGKDRATLASASGRLVYRFHARDLHLVLGPGKDDKPLRFRVSIDGAAPGDAHGADVADDGSGTVTDYRLYQLVRQKHGVADHTFAIEFLDPGVEAYAFTFG